MLYIVLNNGELLLRKDGSAIDLRDIEELRASESVEDFFIEESNSITVLSLKDYDVTDTSYYTIAVRQYFRENDKELDPRYCRGIALTNWRSNTVFCGKCGSKLVDSKEFTARECPYCKNLIFPRIDPCIIVVVKKDDKILLVRHLHRIQNIYACISGFMEAGESVESAVEREVFEEAGIRIKNLRYRGSQSWPFPAQMMLAFIAEYESGEIKVQENEIQEAHWFGKDDNPATPPPGSIAYKLIKEASQTMFS